MSSMLKAGASLRASPAGIKCEVGQLLGSGDDVTLGILCRADIATGERP